MGTRQLDAGILLLGLAGIAVFFGSMQFIFPVTPFEEVVDEMKMLEQQGNTQGLYAEWKPRFHLYIPEEFVKNDTKLMTDLKTHLNHHKVTFTLGKIMEVAYETDDYEKIIAYVRYTDVTGLSAPPAAGTEVPVRLSVLTYNARADEAAKWATSWRDLMRGMRLRQKVVTSSQRSGGSTGNTTQTSPTVPGQLLFNNAPSQAPVAPQVGTTKI